jgi:hypothetical protein
MFNIKKYSEHDFLFYYCFKQAMNGLKVFLKKHFYGGGGWTDPTD